MLVGHELFWKVGANVGAVTLKSGYGSTCGPAFAAGAGSNLGKLKISQDCVLAKFKAKLYCVNPLKDVDSLLLIYWII